MRRWDLHSGGRAKSRTQSLIAMEWLIPLQSFDPKKVRLGYLTTAAKCIAPLSYVDGELRFLSLSLLLPLATVKSYDATTGRLVLTGSAAFQRLKALQESLIQATVANQKKWFPAEKARTIEEIRAGFQSMIDGDTIHLYCPSVANGIQDIATYSKGAWGHGVSGALLHPGLSVRIAIRIQGLSFHQYPQDGWSGKFRLQHRVLSVMT